MIAFQQTHLGSAQHLPVTVKSVNMLEPDWLRQARTIDYGRRQPHDDSFLKVHHSSKRTIERFRFQHDGGLCHPGGNLGWEQLQWLRYRSGMEFAMSVPELRMKRMRL